MEKDKINLALFWPKYSNTVTSLNDLVLGLDKEHYKVIFIYLSDYGVEKNLIEKAGYEVFYLSNLELINAFRLSILFKLIKILKEHQIDILHCHRHKPSFYGALAGIFGKTPVVLSHVHGLSRTRNIGRRFLNYFLFKQFDKIIGCANSVRDDVLKNNPSVDHKKVVALENSVDFERLADVTITKIEAKSKVANVPVDAFVYGTVARFGLYKGHNYLIKAFETVKKQIPSAYLILVGDGPLRDEIQQQVKNSNLDDSVCFLGRRDDVPKLLRAMDAFVLPSVGSEGMPLVILEAMAAGAPCIASSLSGIPEVINRSDVGFLVPPRDEKALAEAMITIAKMPEQKLKDLAERAKERIRNIFDHKIVRAKLAKLYEDEYAFSKEETK